MNRFEIQRYIEQQCHPVSISDLVIAHPNLIRRTLQRWLNTLIKDKQIEVIGDGRSRKYIARIVREEAANSTDNEYDSFPKSIPLSPDSYDILNYLDKPIFEREPVGYARDFLNDYTPNKTYYLSEPIVLNISVRSGLLIAHRSAVSFLFLTFNNNFMVMTP